MRGRRLWTRLGWVLLAVVLGATILALVPEAPAGATGAWLRAQGLEPRHASVDGRSIRYVRSGSGRVVVLIHGFASSLVTWREVLPALAQDHDVVALDLPGFGWSDQPADLSLGMLPRTVVGLMDELRIERASLVGNSLGGLVAVMVAGESPERVERLVLVDAAGFNLDRAARPWLLRVAGSPAGSLLARLPLRRFLVRRALGQVFHDDGLVTDERVEEYVAPLMRPGSAAAMRALLRDTADPDRFREALSRVRAPTLIVWGREDAWIPVDHAARFAHALPGSQAVIFDGCGHLPQEERPAQTLEAVGDFLAGGASPPVAGSP